MKAKVHDFEINLAELGMRGSWAQVDFEANVFAMLSRNIQLIESDNISVLLFYRNNITKNISLEVYFEFDSAELTQDAREQLAPVGEALRAAELETLSFTLEGHTDASGSEDYNLSLSEKRAKSVRDYFINSYSLEPSRVDSVGRGESQLIEGVEENSPVNRRVTIIAQ